MELKEYPKNIIIYCKIQHAQRHSCVLQISVSNEVRSRLMMLPGYSYHTGFEGHIINKTSDIAPRVIVNYLGELYHNDKDWFTLVVE